MNVSASQCGSGSESGWTLYLDQSSYSQTRYQKFNENFMVDDEEQDLSMVSDASSDPRHYYLDYEKCLRKMGACVLFLQPLKAAKINRKSKNLVAINIILNLMSLPLPCDKLFQGF
ncbi:caffeic acid 3-O-methyltransferase-like [Hibiscus syriacus]|uniref:Caffeic acid 3-O-methyltransferase-like n=1 Tax=Hibiscus syriacus TaxID=106335 RepID=A0A6A2Y0R1_HIBSY|nr:protein SOB FIVE-LIKE 6-like [Hibiscus syriacus]KAE8663017.1 caffeic acid 3-O-methyltransferase-like [Hibiscus syriacus]